MGEAEDRIGPVDGNEGGRFGVWRLADPSAPTGGALVVVELLEEPDRQDVPVGGPPAVDLDARDPPGVIAACRADASVDYGWASQVSPGSSVTTSAEVWSRSCSGVPASAGNVA